MIKVEKLAKSYDGYSYALKGISFEIERGEVIGFLGPNGAGKSTTMKILTGFLLPTSGRGTVDGLDVVKQSLAVRRRIGYLPESTPLYMDMRVDEYLRFAAEIRGVKRPLLQNAIRRVVDLCGLEMVTGKNVDELSKGYKQRLGLAQAMIHEPEVLILDEPTSGLDPNQIVEVRNLIKRLGEFYTVILSTHYLQEVEACCSRIMIISQGELVADGSCEELVSELPPGDVLARIKGPRENVLSQIREVLGEEVDISEDSRDGDYGLFRLQSNERREFVQEAVAHLAIKNGWSLSALWREQGTLEEFFRSKTLLAQVEAGDA